MNQFREEINDIDAQLTALFCRRMDIVEKIAAFKSQNGLPVGDGAREERVLANARALAGARDAADVSALYAVLLDLSRARQRLRMTEGGLAGPGEAARESVPPGGPVAYVAADASAVRVRAAAFPGMQAEPAPAWTDVLRAVGEGRCGLGLLPALLPWPLPAVANAVQAHAVQIVGCVPVEQDTGYFCFVRGGAALLPEADRLALLLPWPGRPDAPSSLAARLAAHGVALADMQLRQGWAALTLCLGADSMARAYLHAMRLEHPALLLLGSWRERTP